MDKNSDNSFNIEGSTFKRDELEIDETGMMMKDGTFKEVHYDDLIIDRTLGKGASSYVQLVTSKSTGQRMALKVINMFDKGKREQLVKELRILYDASCCCLVQFYGAFYREGSISIALEYMDRGSLDQVLGIPPKPIPESVLANITFQILWGLAYLKHEKRVHRDIKPQNILINSVGEVKLTDFGISKELEGSIAMCMTYVGTFKYMSPERVQSKPYGYPSDIWSLGLVLMECATGKYPYPICHSYIDMVQTVLENDPPTLSEDKFTREFCSFVADCIQKEPDDRLPADILLGSPWLERHGAIDMDAAVANTKVWVDERFGAKKAAPKPPSESKHSHK